MKKKSAMHHWIRMQPEPLAKNAIDRRNEVADPDATLVMIMATVRLDTRSSCRRRGMEAQVEWFIEERVRKRVISADYLAWHIHIMVDSRMEMEVLEEVGAFEQDAVG